MNIHTSIPQFSYRVKVMQLLGTLVGLSRGNNGPSTDLPAEDIRRQVHLSLVYELTIA